jgi:hypothetical protein
MRELGGEDDFPEGHPTRLMKDLSRLILEVSGTMSWMLTGPDMLEAIA